ncbi:hypothetical protein, partial [Vibrio penaeicida]|uniref:hypothetical protein n=1 Tax=Vibrio penaeicida TaxID=104609 RepID=UPI001F45EC84
NIRSFNPLASIIIRTGKNHIKIEDKNRVIPVNVIKTSLLIFDQLITIPKTINDKKRTKEYFNIINIRINTLPLL